MKNDPFLSQFKTYYPNAWCKDSCDPEFTNIKHPCRGAENTCQFSRDTNVDASTGRPRASSCWRFAFRFHQQEAKDTNGFMIQAEEHGGLGDGQKIETEMAKEAGIKIFRTYTVPNQDPVWWKIEKISNHIQAWYTNGCKDPELLENVWIGTSDVTKPDGTKWDDRPPTERL